MEPRNFIFWGVIGVGAVLGLFCKPKTSGILIFAILVLAVAGLVGAAFLQWIQAEWLLLLMGALPAAAILFISAAVSNILVTAIQRLLIKNARGPE